MSEERSKNQEQLAFPFAWGSEAPAGDREGAEAPADWKVTPATYAFSLTNYNELARFTFTITAPTNSTTARILAAAEIDGKSYHNRRVEIHHDHIPALLLQPPAQFKA